MRLISSGVVPRQFVCCKTVKLFRRFVVTELMCPEKSGHENLLARGSNHEKATLHDRV